MSEIRSFFAGQKVFITGGTGFIGKVLVEKLLRSTKVTTIYFLIRDKRGKSKSQRMGEIFDNVIFSKLQEERPDFKEKIVPIAGDCTEIDLGISPDDRQQLVENVNVVFHVAATIRFDENIKKAYRINFNATRVIAGMCKEMRQLKVFMYVSTAYSNCYTETIEERVYEHPVDYDDLGVNLEKLSEKEAGNMTSQIIGRYPNTYVFTKALTESMILKECSQLPVGIFRPSMVISTYEEPIPGWTSSWGGVMQVSAGFGAGVLKVMQVDKNVKIDVVPVDRVVAALIASAWDTATNSPEKGIPPVYNYVSSVDNGLTYNDFALLLSQYIADYPLTTAIWPPKLRYVKDKSCYVMSKTLLHLVPALLMDGTAVVCLQKPKMLATYKSIHQLSDVLTTFTLAEWTWVNGNVSRLWDRMGKEDKGLFPLTMTTVAWPNFFRTYWPGLRLYLMKQKENTVESARRKQSRLLIVQRLFNLALYFGMFLLVWTVWNRSKL